MKELIKDLPSFQGNLNLSVYECEERGIVLRVDGAQKSDYESYVDELKSAGFSLHDTYDMGKNFHTTLFNDKLALQVYYCECEKTLRVACEPRASLYSNEKNPFSVKGDTVLYQFETDHTLIDCGMCYIIQCPDNSFFIVDSAHYYSFNDNDRIHKFLRDRTPKDEKIVINGWYFSHGHVDHVGKFMDFLRYNYDDVVIEGLYYNFVPNTHPDYTNWDKENILITDNFYKITSEHPEIPVYRVHTGQHFFLRNIELEVLITHEDIYPNSCADYNTSSSVIMLTVGGTKILIPGDSSGIASEIMQERYGESLKCDILQVSHHGHFGLSTKFYELTDADVAFFPTTQIKYDEEFVVYEANRRAVELANYTYIASNGAVSIKLPYDGRGAEFINDETFEDFNKINGLWGYEYTDERKEQLWKDFLARGGEKVGIF